MTYLFDSDHISFLQRTSSRECAAIDARAAAHQPTDFALSAVSLHEQSRGAHDYIARAKTANDLLRGYRMFADLAAVYSGFALVPFDAAALAEFDRLRSAGVRIQVMDLRIASVALVNQLTLLNRNARDFAQVPGLVIDDWTL